MKKVFNATRTANKQGWHTNTDLGCDVKTILRSERKMKVGKDYLGLLRLDREASIDEFISRDAHYTFVETLPWTMKRNPCVFRGKYISITRRDDGTPRLNFKPLKTDGGFSIERYAFGVYLELHKALEGLLGKGKKVKR